MDKIKISFDGQSEHFVNIFYEETVARVGTYIPLNLQSLFIEQYCGALVNSTIPMAKRFTQAEMGLKLSIIEFITNIELSEDFSLDDIVASGFYNSIIKEIKNYNEFMETLKSSIKLVLDFENSYISNQPPYSNLLNKIELFIDKISSVDIDKESVVNLTKAVLDTQKEFNDKWTLTQGESATEQALNMLDAVVESEKTEQHFDSPKQSKRVSKKKAE